MMPADWVEVIGSILILIGAGVFSTAGIGLLLFRDAYARSSAIATAAGMGISLILSGTFCFIPGWETLAKLVAAVMLQLVTSAVGSMAIARSAYLTGSHLHSPTGHDDLAAQERESEPDG